MAQFKPIDNYPANDSSGIYLNDTVWVQFNDLLDPGSVNESTFVVTDSDYVPVDGSSAIQGYSNGELNVVATFYPTDGFRRYEDYKVLVVGGSNGVLSSGGLQLDHDYMYYFKTGALALSGRAGVDPTGVEDLMSLSTDPADRSTPLTVMSTEPADRGTNQDITLQHIAITFNDALPTGTNWYEHITITSQDPLV